MIKLLAIIVASQLWIASPIFASALSFCRAGLVHLNKTPKESALMDRMFEDDTFFGHKSLLDSQDISKVRELIQVRLVKNGSTKEADAMVQFIESALGEKHLPILLDPGVLSRWDTFVDFALANKNNFNKASELRSAFSKELGFVTLYRAVPRIDANQKDIQEVQEKGLWSLFFKSSTLRWSKLYDYFFGGNNKLLSALQKGARSYEKQILDRLYPDRFFKESNNWMSFSYHPEVALSAAYWTQPVYQRLPLVLVEASVPAIEAVALNQGFFKGIHDEPRSIKIEDKIYLQDEVEVFVPLHLPARWVRRVSAFRGNQPAYDFVAGE